MEALLYANEEDEAGILSAVLQQAGLIVRTTHHLNQTIEGWPEHPSDIILLAFSNDVSQAINHVNQLRAVSIVPLVVITDHLAEDALVKFYKSGADLVINRPYSTRLLLYIIHAQLRRTNTISFYSLPLLVQSGVSLDPATRSVSVGEGKSKHLTQLEFRLLYALMIHSGQVIPTERIIENVWGYSDESARDLVRGLIQRLRVKIEIDPHNPEYIHTEQGIGYYFQYNEPQ